jgi:hypothetical protein
VREARESSFLSFAIPNARKTDLFNVRHLCDEAQETVFQPPLRVTEYEHASALGKLVALLSEIPDLRVSSQFDYFPEYGLSYVSEALRDETEGVEGAISVERDRDGAGRGEEGEDVKEDFGFKAVEHGQKRLWQSLCR